MHAFCLKASILNLKRQQWASDRRKKICLKQNRGNEQHNSKPMDGSSS